MSDYKVCVPVPVCTCVCCTQKSEHSGSWWFFPCLDGTVHGAERICGNWRRGKAKTALQQQVPKPCYKDYDEGRQNLVM